MQLSEHNSSTSIYLEQIQNFINVAEGYNTIRKHLFSEINKLAQANSEPIPDDRIAEAVVGHLNQNLRHAVEYHQGLKAHRTIQIIEDLLNNCEGVMSRAMHSEDFMNSLVKTASPRIITFNSEIDSQNRKRVLGILLFWFEKYSHDGDGDEQQEGEGFELFEKAYRHLLQKKAPFPDRPLIHPVEPSSNSKPSAEQGRGDIETNNSTKIIIEDIELFTNETQAAHKESMRKVANTEYVRLIKHKSKMLYEFTAKPQGLTPQDKNKIKDLYKRLRTVLKEIDKFNESNLQKKELGVKEREYVEQKMTPKKKSKESPVKEKEVAQPEPLSINTPAPLVNTQASVKKPVTVDLLDMEYSEPKVTTPTRAKAQVSPAIEIEKKVEAADLLFGDHPAVVPPGKDDEDEFVDGIVVESQTLTSQPQLHKTPTSKSQDLELAEVFSTPTKKSLPSGKEDSLAKKGSNSSAHQNLSFDNQKNAKNAYGYVSGDMNNSSGSEGGDEIKEDVGFSLFGLLGKEKQAIDNKQIYDQNKAYDDIPTKEQPKTGQIQQTPQTPKKIQVDLLGDYSPAKEEVHTPPSKAAKAVDYSLFTVTSPEKQADEDEKFGVEQHRQLDQIEVDNSQAPAQLPLSDE